MDRLVVPAKLPARAAQDAQGDALAKAVPDLALDVERAQCGTTGLGKIPQPEVGVGDVGDRLGLSGAVPKLPAERKSLLETGQRLRQALHAVGHAEIVEHPGLGEPFTHRLRAG